VRVIKEVFEFEWDEGNLNKNLKHKVADQESEEPFLDEDRRIYKDRLHSEKEERFVLLGKTRNSRLLFISFTQRAKKVRIISARDMNRKEVPLYEKKVSPT